MNKNDVKKLNENIIGRYIPIILTLLTVGVGVWQYTESAEREIRKEFYYKQVQSYENILNGVSNLMNNQTNNKDSIIFELHKFKKLTQGSFLLYTADTVNFYVLTFNHYYERYLRHDQITKANLEIINYKLINSCRYSLNRTLGADLEEIEFKKPLR